MTSDKKDTMTALRSMLEDERLNLQKQYGLEKFPVQNIQTTKEFTQDINFARRETHSDAYKSGHEAATNRLLGIVEHAVAMAEFYSSTGTWKCYDGYIENGSIAFDDDGKKAREFLSELKDLK